MINRVWPVAVALCAGSIASVANAQVVRDGSFEAGTPSTAWREFSLVFGTPLCDSDCSPTGISGARTGVWWVWFGGIDSEREEGNVEQTITFPAGSSRLEFYLTAFSDRPDAADFMTVSIGGTQVFRVDSTGLAPYENDYVLVQVDTTRFAGQSLALKFDSVTTGGGFLTNFFVDDVAVSASSPPPPPPPPACAVNCNGDINPTTGRPILDVQDFSCFQNAFALGDLSKADVGGSTACSPDGVLNISDFSCFQNLFAIGCP